MKRSHFDAPFWGLLILGVVLVGTLAMIGLAAAAQEASRTGAGVVVVDDS
jgi:hypothetical protein